MFLFSGSSVDMLIKNC